jgi:hypothetical protein
MTRETKKRVFNWLAVAGLTLALLCAAAGISAAIDADWIGVGLMALCFVLNLQGARVNQRQAKSL